MCFILPICSSIVEAADLSGSYKTLKGIGPSLVLTSAKQGRYLVQISTTDGFGCGGDFNGNGRLHGSTITVTPVDDPSSKCIVSLTPLKGTQIRIDENGCSTYHGASCEFNGIVARVESLGAFPELSKMRQKHIQDILENPKISRSLIALLGRKYNVLMDNVSVSSPPEVLQERYYCASGNKPHRGGSDNGAICIDQESGRIDVWLLEDGRQSYYGQGIDSLPLPVSSWAKEKRLPYYTKAQDESYTDSKDIQLAKKLVSELPPMCKDSWYAVSYDGTVTIRILCIGPTPDKSVDGEIQIKDGFVKKVR